MLAGFDPAEVQFRLVVNLAHALLIEIYQGYDMKFDTAMTELNKALVVPGSPAEQKATKQTTEADEAASMAMLQSMMSGSDFKGPKG